MKRTLALLVAGLALAVAGCGSSDKSASDTPAPATSGSPGKTAATPATTSTAAKAGGGKSTDVEMKNIAFSPKAVTVKVGDKVQWENYDTVDHNVTATSGAGFKSKDFGKDGTFAFTPTKPGKIAYTCTLHPGMDGTITVTG